MCFIYTLIVSTLLCNNFILASAGSKYVGCFRANSPTVLSWKKVGREMTVSTCSQICSEENSTVYGLRYGNECHCGRISTLLDVLDEIIPKSDEKCNTLCRGGPRCGGNEFMAIYNGTSYNGCYHYDVTDQQSDFQLMRNLTHAVCAHLCSQSPFWSVTQGSKCSCRSSLPSTSTKVNDTHCYEKGEICIGGEKCGGSGNIAIFSEVTEKTEKLDIQTVVCRSDGELREATSAKSKTTEQFWTTTPNATDGFTWLLICVMITSYIAGSLATLGCVITRRSRIRKTEGNSSKVVTVDLSTSEPTIDLEEGTQVTLIPQCSQEVMSTEHASTTLKHYTPFGPNDQRNSTNDLSVQSQNFFTKLNCRNSVACNVVTHMSDNQVVPIDSDIVYNHNGQDNDIDTFPNIPSNVQVSKSTIPKEQMQDLEYNFTVYSDTREANSPVAKGCSSTENHGSRLLQEKPMFLSRTLHARRNTPQSELNDNIYSLPIFDEDVTVASNVSSLKRECVTDGDEDEVMEYNIIYGIGTHEPTHAFIGTLEKELMNADKDTLRVINKGTAKVSFIPPSNIDMENAYAVSTISDD